jgi:hypothetical protein
VSYSSIVRVRVDSQERGALQTDKHIRCETGSGSFNYRMKFPVNLPLPSSDEAGRRFVVQVRQNRVTVRF